MSAWGEAHDGSRVVAGLVAWGRGNRKAVQWKRSAKVTERAVWRVQLPVCPGHRAGVGVVQCLFACCLWREDASTPSPSICCSLQPIWHLAPRQTTAPDAPALCPPEPPPPTCMPHACPLQARRVPLKPPSSSTSTSSLTARRASLRATCSCGWIGSLSAERQSQPRSTPRWGRGG